MKKVSILQLLVLAGLVLQSTSILEAKDSENKSSSEKKCSKPRQSQKDSHESGKSCMKKHEHQIEQIKKDFKTDKITAQQANDCLDEIAQQAKKDIALMKKEEKHGQMWKVHQNTLQRKIKEARQFIRDFMKKHSQSK